jgi:RNA polymerase sigma-70 factor (family 1)
MNSDKYSLSDQLRNGDKKALDEIYALYYSKIRRFAYSYLKDDDDSNDIIQDVFIKIWESRHKLKKHTQLEPLLYTITKNSVLSLFRKKSTEKKYLDYLQNCATANNSGTEELTDFEFIKEQYKNLIPKLPPERRDIFILSREKGLTNKEIAKRKNISEKTIENQITKALSFFKEQLEKSGVCSIIYFYLFINL